ncbi:sugar diacid recognition domain-containing protein [Clostridium arbusti]|uniref:sugar diacid recognition domain-containing protein n=1 Tax=Clostridium arbusti TaxID=1137848 RepID=UPI0002886165|nr:sugar diacid recognition domain-containing protein [Clostridium arbusti]
MGVLSRELAESIIDRTMKVVKNNINIMDENGIIIASGDKSRIGTVHEGAIIAIERKSQFNIDEKQSKNLNGVCEGTNLIIRFQNKIVGVIGITGKPRAVLGYGKLIKLTAEMMIEQEYVMKNLEFNNRIKEELMMALIYNKQSNSSMLENYIKKFKIPYDYPMSIFIFEVQLKDISSENDLNLLKSIIILLEGILKESLVASIDSKTIVVLYKHTYRYNKFVDYKRKIQEIYNKIYNKIGVKIKISVGKTYNKLFETYRSFNIAKETLLFGKKMHPNDDIYFFDTLKYEMLLLQNNTNWKINELKDTYDAIASSDKDGELRETLKIFIKENGELNNVSNKLFIHRNTLNYRLNKIYKLTNMNPKKYTDLFWLYCAIINPKFD